MPKIRNSVILSLLLTALAAGAGFSVPAADAPAKPGSWDTYSDTWVGVDGLGRALPTFETVGPPRPHKQVGIFYFLWVDGRTGKVNDNDVYLQAHPNATVPYVKGEWHWWAEPLFGYYKIDDPFVLRKHAQMLQDAGVDTLAFDSTNSYLHEPQYTALCQVYQSMRDNGQPTPQFFHVTNAQSGKTVQKIYDEFYAKNLYPDLWFRWLDKPLILGHPAEMSPQMLDYFTTRYSWAYDDSDRGAKSWFKDGHDKWPWILSYPQTYGWHTVPTVPEETSVAVAHHAHTTRGRSLSGSLVDGKWQEQEPPPGERHPEQGIQFGLQAAQALKIDPPFVFVTGWNEWIAPIGRDPGRKFLGHVLGPNDAFFVDEYSPEFSRDMEPMSTQSPGSFGDNYYYQLVSFVRRYKGVRPLPAVTLAHVSLSSAFAAWSKVGPEFRDDIGDPVHRDFDGFATGSHFVNQTGRNDIVAAKVSYDAKNIYFYVRTKDALTPHTGPDWMRLYLNTDGDYQTGWMGYDFRLNGKVGNTTTSLERCMGTDYQWSAAGQVKYHAAGNEMVIAVPRALLGAKTLPKAIDFKWADHCYAKGDWTDFTLNGDAAPNDRFNYRAKF